MRARQTAEIINQNLKLPLNFHEGLCQILPEKIMSALNDILKPGSMTLIVSHGEVYRVLVNELNAQSADVKAVNCKIYLFNPPLSDDSRWVVSEF